MFKNKNQVCYQVVIQIVMLIMVECHQDGSDDS